MIMNPKSRKAMYANMTHQQKNKVVNDYNSAHDVIGKMRKKEYSSIPKGEYVRKVRRYHNTIDKYEKVFGTKPNSVIKMS
jgi:hypothetical protein